MKNKLAENIEQSLRSYSALANYWDEEAGDTHEMLSFREYLAENDSFLSRDEREKMQAVDAIVIRLSEDVNVENTWDVVMLRKTADLIRGKVPAKKAA